MIVTVRTIVCVIIMAVIVSMMGAAKDDRAEKIHGKPHRGNDWWALSDSNTRPTD
jgi:hypothetical protein